MVIINSLKGWGLRGIIKMIFYEIYYFIENGSNTFKQIGYKSFSHNILDNYNIPTPAIYIYKLEKILNNLSEFTFVDVGSGRGRALSMAMKLNFKKIISIEKSKKLNKNLRSIFGDKIVYFEKDAQDFEIEKTSKAIFYFFESFDEEIFFKFVKKQIANNAFQSLFLVLVYSTKENMIDEYLKEFNIYFSYECSDRRKLIILKKK